MTYVQTFENLLFESTPHLATIEGGAPVTVPHPVGRYSRDHVCHCWHTFGLRLDMNGGKVVYVMAFGM